MNIAKKLRIKKNFQKITPAIMEKVSLTKDIQYNEGKPTITVLLKTKTSKEIRIVMKKGQEMKEHTAPYPIMVELFEGAIDFGVNGKKTLLQKGDLVALAENVPHDLTCVEDCIIRLSISVHDKPNRIKGLID